MREVREHVKEEEGEVFPQMRKVFSDDELVELGMKVASSRWRRPGRTRPLWTAHPQTRSWVR